VRGSLPLSLGMVGTDLFQLMRALGSGARVAGGDQKTRAVERFEDVVFGEISCFWEISCLGGTRGCYVSWVAHGPTLLELWSRA